LSGLGETGVGKPDELVELDVLLDPRIDHRGGATR